MYLKESEIRRIIRKRLLQEKSKEYEQTGGEVAGDVATGVAAGAAGIAGATAVGGAAAGIAGMLAPAIGTAGGVIGSAAAAGSAAAGGSAIAAGAAGASSAVSAALASGPPGWAIGAGVALGLGVAYILLDEGDVGGDVEAILNGTWADKTNTELKKVEEETKAKLKESGAEEQLANFPPLTHYNDIMDLHSKMAKRLYRATKGGFMGMGTDEDEIEKVIQTTVQNGFD
jgi:hypothetical protein